MAVKRAEGIGWDVDSSVAAHADGSATVMGYFYGAADFGGLSLFNAGDWAMFVAHAWP